MSSGSANPDRAPAPAAGQPAEGERVASGPGTVSNRERSPPLDRPARLIDDLVEATVASRGQRPEARSRLDAFLDEPSPVQALRQWLGSCPERDPRQLLRRLNRDVALIDRLINDQLNAILHHPRFQRVEAAWRGLDYLVQQVDAESEAGIKVKVLHATWKELERDFERAVEFDQSQLFRKVYDQEFGHPGGEPFGVLIGDYQVQPWPTRDHPHDDVGVLKAISEVAAAAFCPFVAAASPALFGLDHFGGLEQSLDHQRTLQQVEYLKWRTFRQTEDARFVGLTLPHVLLRPPYQDDGSRVDRFCFHEDVAAADGSKYLWGNAAFAFAGVLVRAYAQAGWLADIRGVRRGLEGGGLVTRLPVHDFGTDRAGLVTKSPTDVVITDALEKELSELGFIPLCHCKDTRFAAFYSNQSVQQPKKYDRPAATTNAKISAMLQYMLCVSRFAHYIKVLGRDKVGSFSEPEHLEQFLQNWIVKYVTADLEASPEVKARFPLRQASVQVRDRPGRPGEYQCILHLVPHYELDQLTASVRLATALAPSRVG